MTPSQIFWTYAFLTLTTMVALLGVAVRAARRGRAVTHRRYVLLVAAAGLLFVAAYIGKLAWLGRENKAGWRAVELAFLYAHEMLVLVMVVTGGLAAVRGRRLFSARARGRPVEAAHRRRHARLGYLCLAAAAGALATGVVVYVGIVLR